MPGRRPGRRAARGVLCHDRRAWPKRDRRPLAGARSCASGCGPSGGELAAREAAEAARLGQARAAAAALHARRRRRAARRSTRQPGPGAPPARGRARGAPHGRQAPARGPVRPAPRPPRRDRDREGPGRGDPRRPLPAGQGRGALQDVPDRRRRARSTRPSASSWRPSCRRRRRRERRGDRRAARRASARCAGCGSARRTAEGPGGARRPRRRRAGRAGEGAPSRAASSEQPVGFEEIAARRARPRAGGLRERRLRPRRRLRGRAGRDPGDARALVQRGLRGGGRPPARGPRLLVGLRLPACLRRARGRASAPPIGDLFDALLAAAHGAAARREPSAPLPRQRRQAHRGSAAARGVHAPRGALRARLLPPPRALRRAREVRRERRRQRRSPADRVASATWWTSSGERREAARAVARRHRAREDRPLRRRASAACPTRGARGIGAVLRRIAEQRRLGRIVRGRPLDRPREGRRQHHASSPAASSSSRARRSRTIHETCTSSARTSSWCAACREPLGIVWLCARHRPDPRLGRDPAHAEGALRDHARLPADARRARARHDAPDRHRAGELRLRTRPDMVAKIRTALGVSPIVTAIFANSASAEGKPAGFVSRRLHIWRTPIRTAAASPPFVFEDGLRLRRYVEWALDVPMFFVVRDGRYRAGARHDLPALHRAGLRGRARDDRRLGAPPDDAVPRGPPEAGHRGARRRRRAARG